MSRKYYVAGAIVLSILLITGVYALVGVGLSDTSTSEQNLAENGRTISVSASGQVKADPDMAIVRLASTAVADDPTAAREQLASNVSKMLGALEGIGLSEDDIRTTSYNLFERHPYPRDESPDKNDVEYYARQSFEVEVDDISRAGEIIDTAVDNGANQVMGVEFTLSEATQRELRKQALEDAMSDAKDQATVIANSANLSIAGVHSVTTSNIGFIPINTFVREDVAGGDGASTVINPGPLTVRATVHVTYDATQLP